MRVGKSNGACACGHAKPLSPHLAHRLVALVAQLGHLLICVVLALVPGGRVVLQVHRVHTQPEARLNGARARGDERLLWSVGVCAELWQGPRGGGGRSVHECFGRCTRACAGTGARCFPCSSPCSTSWLGASPLMRSSRSWMVTLGLLPVFPSACRRACGGGWQHFGTCAQQLCMQASCPQARPACGQPL